MTANVSSAAADPDDVVPAENRPEDRQEANRRVAKNTSIYLVAQIVSWTITFINVAVLPRHLGETLCGYAALASSTVGMALSMVTLGVEYHLVRSIGRSRADSERLLRAAFGLRLITTLPLFLLILGLVLFTHLPAPVWTLILIGAPGSFLVLFSDCLRSANNGWEQAKRVSLTDMLFSVAGIIGIPLVLIWPNFTGLKLLTGLSMLMGVVIFTLRYRWVHAEVRLKPTFHLHEWRELIGGGLPFVINNIINQFYVYASLLILRHFTDAAAVGVYGQATRLAGAFLFLPTALCSALLPSLSRLAHSDVAEFRRTQSQVLSLLIVLALPMTVGVILLASPLCRALYGPDKFLALPLALRYTALTILPLYIVSTMYQFLVAQNRNAIWTFFMLGTVAVYAVSSWLLIPLTLRLLHNGIVGAVAGTVIAEGVSAVCALCLLKANPFSRESVGGLLRAVLATAIMGGAVWATQTLLHSLPAFVVLVAGAGMGTLVFLSCILTLHVLPAEQEQRVLILLASRLAFLRRTSPSLRE